MYIYHNKKIDEYFSFNNLARLSSETGIDYDSLKHQFSRKKETRLDHIEWTIVKVEPVKRKGAK
jgi:hypothetical protein